MDKSLVSFKVWKQPSSHNYQGRQED